MAEHQRDTDIKLPRSRWPEEEATERLDHRRNLEEDSAVEGEEISSKQQSNTNDKGTDTGSLHKGKQIGQGVLNGRMKLHQQCGKRSRTNCRQRKHETAV